MKILMIGGTGQLGHFVLKHLANAGHELVAVGLGSAPEPCFLPDGTVLLDRDTNAASIDELAQMLRGVDAVIHAAGADGRNIFAPPAIDAFRALPTIVGYLLAGVALGPFTPGFRGDAATIQQMAEFGVILLMFGIGLHFNVSDLWEVRRVVLPAAVIQMAAVAFLGYLLARSWGFSLGGAWVLGISGAVASTVVMLRALMDRGWLDSPHGKVAIGWLVVEDLLTVAILVLLPVLAGPSTVGPWATAGWAIGKAVLFVALMMFAGARVVPAILARVVHTRSRELFVLVALTMAAGTARSDRTSPTRRSRKPSSIKKPARKR